MGELGIILALLCFVWVYAIVNDPRMGPGEVPLVTGIVALGLGIGAFVAGVASAIGV